MLNSPFTDYYDWWFDKEGDYVFNRPNESLSKTKQFELLNKAGFTTPKYGSVLDLCATNIDTKLVVYLDEFKHRGEGKLLLTGRDAVAKGLTSNLAAEYKDCWVSTSLRRIYVGHSLYIELEYKSKDLWRSNCGDVEIRILKYAFSPYAYSSIINFPLFAIDYVRSSGIYYAIDLNTSPGLIGTGIEDVFTSRYLVDLIKKDVILNSNKE